MARVRLANQLLAALTPGKAARGAETGEGKRKGKRKREKQVRTLSGARETERGKRGEKSNEGRQRVECFIHPSAGLHFFQLELLILAPGYVLSADTSSAGLGEEV